MIEEKVLEILEELIPNVDFKNEKSLADDGYIDSLSVVNIITEISVEFDVEVPFEALVNENFNSVETISDLIRRLQNGSY